MGTPHLWQLGSGFLLAMIFSVAGQATDAKAMQIELHVIDPANQAPVLQARVSVEAPDFKSYLTTDDTGTALISIPQERPRYIAVRVSKDGYVPRLISWSLDQSSFSPPPEFRLSMEKATTIGGIVQNEQGQPVPGAAVVMIIRGSSMGGANEQVFNDIWERKVKTDENGKWEFNEAPSDLHSLSVKLEHPDYISDEPIRSLPSDEDFRQKAAVLVLRKGTPCEGFVTNETGQPIANATVTSGEAGTGSTTFPSTQTDGAGHFRFASLAVSTLPRSILTFTAQGYAPELVEFPLPSGGPPQVKLGQGGVLRLRLTDSKGNPVAGVRVVPNYWRKHRPFDMCGWNTDQNGCVTWDHAPLDAVIYEIVPANFQRISISLLPGDTQQTIILHGPTIVSGTVTDAQTHQSIPQFRLIVGGGFPPRDSIPAKSYWDRGSAITVENGQFQYRFTDPVLSTYPDGSPAQVGFHLIRIEADGYAPVISRQIANEEENVQLDFALQAAAPVRGTVTAAGKPVAGAQIMMGGDGNPATVRDGKCLSKWTNPVITTDENGTYVLPQPERDFPIAIVDPDAGYALTTFETLKQTPDVALQPWGAIAIKTTAPLGKLSFNLMSEEEFEGIGKSNAIPRPFNFYSIPIQKEPGVILYSHLPAGTMRVMPYGPIDGSPSLQVESGKTAVLDLRKDGRAVVGKIALPENPSLLAALRTVPSLVPEPPAPPASLSAEDQEKWRAAWSQTPEGQAYEKAYQKFTFRLDPDGTFRIDNVPPGRYQCRVLIPEPKATSDGNFKVWLATSIFSLLAGADDFDLGTIAAKPIQGESSLSGSAPVPPK